jgi:hypothetical protein
MAAANPHRRCIWAYAKRAGVFFLASVEQIAEKYFFPVGAENLRKHEHRFFGNACKIYSK